MGISLIAAMSENRVIGRANTIPWRIPGEQKRFKELTLGHTLIMGRKTYESIGRPLPGRVNIIVTRDPHFSAPGCTVVHSLEEALSAADSTKEIFIAGGEQIYRQSLAQADRIYLTIVHANVEGDAAFPEFLPTDFLERKREEITGEPGYTCYLYERAH